jgi:ATP-dependent Lon protease
VLSTLNVTERIEKTLLLLKKELELSKLQSEISKQVEDKMSANQRRYMLMEQLKHIKKEYATAIRPEGSPQQSSAAAEPRRA